MDIIEITTTELGSTATKNGQVITLVQANYEVGTEGYQQRNFRSRPNYEYIEYVKY